MKDRRGSSGGERFAVFPFSMGCMSQSAVSVADPSEKKPQSEASSSTTTAQRGSSEEAEQGGGETMAKDTKAAAAAPGASPALQVAAGVSRLVKGIKQSLSQMFAAYEGEEEDEEEPEMVIGYPTDVQHVGHIGWDGHGGLSKVGAAMGMVNAFSLPSSLSLHQLEIAMDQAAHA